MSASGAVLGLGLDLVEVEPFHEQLNRSGTSFGEGTFTPGETAAAMDSGEPTGTAFARHLAARFAAKEAFVKAWSMGRAGLEPAMEEVCWREIEVVNDSWGRPRLVLAGSTKQRLRETMGEVEVSISLTHEDTVAAAVVVITGVQR